MQIYPLISFFKKIELEELTLKKLIGRIIVGLLSALLIFTMAACGQAKTWSVTFDYNYEGAPESKIETVNDGEKISKPTDPVRDGYEFIGWYSDKDCEKNADFGRIVSKDTTYYAGWNKTSFTVTFVLGYDGAVNSTQQVAKNSTATYPQEPEREGYIFENWYADVECTQVFDFNTKITEDTNIYANWTADSGNTVTITYHYNYENAPNNGVYRNYRQEKGLRLPANITPVREGYLFNNWYTDAACTQKVSSKTVVNGNMDLYAKWLTQYTFEAEYVDVSELHGFGYSGNADGVAMIERDVFDMNASNNYYLGWLYNTGLEIVFNIDAAEDVSGVVITLRLSAEYGDANRQKTITDESFKVTVNDNKVSYPSITFYNLPDGSDEYKPAFQNYQLNINVSLKKGTNVIKLIVNNSEKGEGGTMKATAPMVDCMYLYSDVALQWAEGFPKTGNVG